MSRKFGVSRKSGRMTALTMAALLAASPAAAFADEWAADHAHSAAMNADQIAHTAAEHRTGSVGAGKAMVPNRFGGRARTIHATLNRQANQLSHLTAR